MAPAPPHRNETPPTAAVELPVIAVGDPVAELPLIGAPPTERCDAARNRRRILAAADRLIAAHGADAVSVDQIALAAGVGKGTIFRRFGDRATLLRSLLSEREAAFQDAFIRGPGPLGPGDGSVPARDRLIAFGPAVLEIMDHAGELIRASERATRPGARQRHPVLQVYRTHMTMLLREAAPSLDADYTADALLAALAADLVLDQLRERAMSHARLVEGWCALVEKLTA